MNDEQLQALSKTLNIDYTLLKLIYDRYHPKDDNELIKLANSVTAIRNESGTTNPQDLLNLYATQSGQINPSSINFDEMYQQGYQFQPRNANDLAGQCAWFAEQITRLADGSNWIIGNSFGEKQQNLLKHKEAGNAFLRGEAQPEVGNSVVINSGNKYGHVAVVNEVLPDNRIRVTESNWNGDRTVTHDRILDSNDNDIIGYLKTKPTKEFKVGAPKTDPKTPTTPKVKQRQVVAPRDMQELPREQQPVKVDDLEVGNPNAQILEQETKLDKQTLATMVTGVPASDLTEQIEVAKTNPQPVPTPTQTPVPTATPTPVPTATPSATPTPTNTPNPTNTLTQAESKLLEAIPLEQRADAQQAIPLIAQALRDEGILNAKTLGYALATVSHESGFKPKEEVMAQRGVSARNNYIADLQQNYEGGTDYRGRGYIQLTHKGNYDKFGKRIGTDLVNNPQQLLEPQTSSKVLAAFFKDNGVADAVMNDDYDRARVLVQGQGALNKQFIGKTREIGDMARKLTQMTSENDLTPAQKIAQAATPTPKPNILSTFAKNANNVSQGVSSLVNKISPIRKPPEIKSPTIAFQAPQTAYAVKPTSPAIKPAPTNNVRVSTPMRSPTPAPRPVYKAPAPVIKPAPVKVNMPKPMSTPKIMSTPKVTQVKVQSKPSVVSTAKKVINKVTSYFKR